MRRLEDQLKGIIEKAYFQLELAKSGKDMKSVKRDIALAMSLLGTGKVLINANEDPDSSLVAEATKYIV